MKKFTLARFVAILFISISVLQSCKKTKDTVQAPAPVPDQTYTQEFDNIASATSAGWKFLNLSETHTTGTVGFVNGAGFPAYSGAGFIFAGYQANNGDGLISVWAISPKVTMQNGDKITFYTLSVNDYTDPANVYPDRLQLRASLYKGDAIKDDPTDVGGFTVNLVDVNPTLSGTPPQAYPNTWTKFEGTISGLSKPVDGYFAFRYFVADGGTNGANSNGIAIDKVTYTSVNHQ
ncbi:MAG: choice-of-anchor J domain-containing protein [Bacteroidota bacterium]|nr:choice-of-anchor J domain-containing protein [Bacteroidota bacterium]